MVARHPDHPREALGQDPQSPGGGGDAVADVPGDDQPVPGVGGVEVADQGLVLERLTCRSLVASRRGPLLMGSSLGLRPDAYVPALRGHRPRERTPRTLTPTSHVWHHEPVPPRHRTSLPIPARIRAVMAEGDYERAGLLDGLIGEERRTRVSVLESLAADGVAIDTMRDAIDRDRLGLLLLERTLRPEDGHSFTDVCTLTGIDPDVVRRWFQALGRPLGPEPRRADLHRRGRRDRPADPPLPQPRLHRPGDDAGRPRDRTRRAEHRRRARRAARRGPPAAPASPSPSWRCATPPRPAASSRTTRCTWCTSSPPPSRTASARTPWPSRSPTRGGCAARRRSPSASPTSSGSPTSARR